MVSDQHRNQKSSEADSSSLSDSERKDQRRIVVVSIVAASSLVLLKLVVSITSGSLGLLAEALHSGADLAAAILTFFAIRVSQRPPDRRHPFGHGRAEHLAALVEALLLLAAILYITIEALRRLVGEAAPLVVTKWTLLAMLLIICIDIWRTIVSHRAAHRYSSPALSANALHFASDLAGSSAVLVGLLIAKAGFPAADAAAALVVAAIVAVSASRLLWENAQVLMDVVPESAERIATRAIHNLDLPISLRRLRIRRSSGHYLADITIGVAATDHVSQGHALASAVENAVRQALPGSDIVVHVEPDETGSSLRERTIAAALEQPGIFEVHNVKILLIDGVPECSLHLKVRPDMRLDSAHDLTDRVELAIRRAIPEMAHVDVHIEPVQERADIADAVKDPNLSRQIGDIVRDVTGHPPEEIRIRETDNGLRGYVTMIADPHVPLIEAHNLAMLVEEKIMQAVPEFYELVVHTEPNESSTQ